VSYSAYSKDNTITKLKYARPNFPQRLPAKQLVLETVPNEDLREVQAEYDNRRCQWDACVRADYCLSVRHDSESPAAEKDYLTPKQRSAAKSHLLTSMCFHEYSEKGY